MSPKSLILRIVVSATLVACGVEETGYLTEEGVLFTDDIEQAERMLIVTPDAFRRDGGVLSVRTYDEIDAGSQDVLPGETLVFSIGAADGADLTYRLDDLESTRSAPFQLDSGPPPIEDPVGLGTPWVLFDGDQLLVQPEVLLGSLPWLVVNRTNGATALVASTAPESLSGGPGDRVCVSEMLEDTLTTSNCATVSE